MFMISLITVSRLCKKCIPTFFLQERCAAAETASLVARVLNRSRAHLHSVLSKNNTSVVEDFFRTLVNFLYFERFCSAPVSFPNDLPFVFCKSERSNIIPKFAPSCLL